MAKRSRANRTEKATYQNNRNEHKFIDVVHHGDGHYYIIQYIKHEFPERTVINYTGTCLLYTSPSPRDVEESRMPSSA